MPQGFQDVQLLPLLQHSHPLLFLLVVLDDLGDPGRKFQRDQCSLANNNTHCSLTGGPGGPVTPYGPGSPWEPYYKVEVIHISVLYM